MFGLFRSARFSDPQLGGFLRSRGYWRGSMNLSGSSGVPLAISGNRKEPDPHAIQIVRDLCSLYSSWKPIIECALFEHYVEYAAALAEDDAAPPHEPLPVIEVAAQVWPHVELSFLSVTPMGGHLTTEFGYRTAWDEEHLVGARFQANRMIELCGSVVPV